MKETKTTKVTKTSKVAKTTAKAATTKNDVTAKTKKSVTAKSKSLSEDDIRAKAQEIYDERIARGEHGTATDDWHKAETILKGKMKK